MTKNSYKDQVVWIIGASSGIGSALADELSQRGAILALSARRKDELEKLKSKLGKDHKVFAVDVTDIEVITRTAQAIHAAYEKIDRVIFLAAAYAPMKMDKIDITIAKAIVDINITGAFNLVHATLPILRQQKTSSQIALCGSVAGYIGLPGGQPYSSTKAAITNLAESLYAECHGIIDVKLISPGFVRTSLTDKNNFDMPMIIEPQQAARAIADGLLSNSFEVHFPKKFTLLMKVLHLLPYSLSLPLIRRIKT